MKTLIAIVNARHRADWRAKIRSTWGPEVPRDLGIDAFFFVGRGTPIPDMGGVVELDCNDDYKSIPEKVRAIAKWAREHGYHFMLKCDDDVVLRPTLFATSGYEQHKYSGRANRPPQPYTVPYGFCYVLNHECMDIIIGTKLPGGPEPFDDEKWVAETLWHRGIQLTSMRRYFLYHCVNYQMAAPDAFALCIHLPSETQAIRLREFDKAYKYFGGKLPSHELLNGREFVNRRRDYVDAGLIQNWWDTH